jgi:hypothetical protein
MTLNGAQCPGSRRIVRHSGWPFDETDRQRISTDPGGAVQAREPGSIGNKELSSSQEPALGPSLSQS